MRIEVKGRNLQVSDDMREVVARRFEKVDKQVSDLATLEVELSEERNPANPDASRDHKHSINLVADELARQVKRHRDKRRRRREQRAGAPEAAPPMAEPGEGAATAF
jgi:putative sigma-54 modulation protein